MREKNYSAEEQTSIQKERALSDVALVKDGAKFKEAGRLEVTTDQLKSAKKAMEAEMKVESPEVKSLEELKQRAIEAGASPEEIETLDAKLEIARMSGEEYITKLENELNQAIMQRQKLESRSTQDDLEKQAEKRKDRDRWIGAVSSLGSAGVITGGLVFGGVLGGPVGLAASAGLVGGGLAMLGSPIARIQNWIERRRHEKDLGEAREKEEKLTNAHEKAEKSVE